MTKAMKNESGVEIIEGMRVSGYIHCDRGYGRFYIKDIKGTIVNKHGRLYVNSDDEPTNNYPLHKFEHSFLTDPNVISLEVI